MRSRSLSRSRIKLYLWLHQTDVTFCGPGSATLVGTRAGALVALSYMQAKVDDLLMYFSIGLRRNGQRRWQFMGQLCQRRYCHFPEM
jgi:hypothetical protein